MAENSGKTGFLGRLREQLSRSASRLAGDFTGLFRGRKIDADLLDDLEARLIGADVGLAATQAVLENLRTRVARRELSDVDALFAALRAELLAIIAPCARPLMLDSKRKPSVVMVVGVNGSGKTTSIGKLALRLSQANRKVMLAAGDTFRAAAAEQLDIWAERSGSTIVQQASGADPGAVVFDALRAAQAQGMDVLIVDTAGRLHNQSHLMEELKKVRRVLTRVDPAAPDEVLLVLDANQGQNALAQAREFHAAVGVTGLVLTKLDGTARGGIVVAIARELKLPIRFIGIGEQPGDFGEFEAAAFVDALLGTGPGVKSAA
ncbi:MAG: signal recognition particle-docking protein FtsY [Pseudomonadota bacterium]